MVRILIADDHPVVRIGIRGVLSEIPNTEVTGEAANGHEVLEKVQSQDFDIILLDISMPGNGLDVLKELKRIKPDQKVLVLSIYPEEQYAVRAIKAGAAGYLTKDSAPDELMNAIKRISPALAEHLASEMEHDSERPAHDVLSDREFQVMRLIAQGKTVKKAAEELGLSAKTVSTYRTRVLDKLQMKNTNEMIRYAIEKGLCG
jgi:two-component system, NarL family, invasion response regulator UvrY